MARHLHAHAPQRRLPGERGGEETTTGLGRGVERGRPPGQLGPVGGLPSDAAPIGRRSLRALLLGVGLTVCGTATAAPAAAASLGEAGVEDGGLDGWQLSADSLGEVGVGDTGLDGWQLSADSLGEVGVGDTGLDGWQLSAEYGLPDTGGDTWGAGHRATEPAAQLGEVQFPDDVWTGEGVQVAALPPVADGPDGTPAAEPRWKRPPLPEPPRLRPGVPPTVGELTDTDLTYELRVLDRELTNHVRASSLPDGGRAHWSDHRAIQGSVRKVLDELYENEKASNRHLPGTRQQLTSILADLERDDLTAARDKVRQLRQQITKEGAKELKP